MNSNSVLIEKFSKIKINSEIPIIEFEITIIEFYFI